MADVVLSDGREINFDLYKLSIAEFRALIDPNRPNEEGDSLIAKVSGLSLDEVLNLPYPDYRLLVRAFFDKASNPLADPN